MHICSRWWSRSETTGERSCAEDRGAGEGWDEGIGWFAAKHGIGLDERALGMEAEMVFGGNTCSSQSEVPLPPIVGKGMEVGFKPKTIVVDSPTARRLCKGYRLWVIGYRMGLFGTVCG